MSIKNVLITGNLGYVGSVMTPVLAERGYHVSGLDTGYFNDEAPLYELLSRANRQIRKDIRDVTKDDFEGIDAVIHLASLSNDPLGELLPNITEEINYAATVRVAECAKEAGAKRFLYASSQSMYGIADTTSELDEDDSEKNPLTSYAKTKWMAELELKKMSAPTFSVTCFRPSTVFGASPKLRCDIVFNNLVGCAYTTKKIEIKSDGTPWRPVIHARDVTNAFQAGLEAPLELVESQSFNVGLPNGNFTVRELAEAAQKVVPGSTLVFTGEHGNDARTYRVSFKRIHTVLKDYFRPEWNLVRGGTDLVEVFSKISFTEEMFRGSTCIRLAHLKKLIEQRKLSADLRWLG